MRTIKEILNGEKYDLFLQKGYFNPAYWIERVSGLELSPFAKEWINLVHNNRFVNIVSFRGCFPFDTLVFDKDGYVKKISEFDSWSEGVKPVYRVFTKSGNIVDVTANHLFLTPNGFEKLEDLKVGDEVTVLDSFEKFGDNSIKGVYDYNDAHVRKHKKYDFVANNNFAKILGYLTTDSYYITAIENGQSIQFSNTNKELIEEFVSLVNIEFPDLNTKIVEKPGCKEFRNGKIINLKSSYIVYVTSNTRNRKGNRLRWISDLLDFDNKFPRAVFNFSKENVAFFLNRSFSSDGCVYVRKGENGKKYCELSFYSGKKFVYAKYYQLLLLKLGIRSRLKIHKRNGFGDNFDLVISERRFVKKFFDVVGLIFGKEDKSMEASIISNEPYDKKFFGRKEDVVNIDFSDGEGLVTSKIVRVEYIGEKEVFDMEVPNKGWYLADGFAVHNSAKTTILAIWYPLWMAWYLEKKDILIVSDIYSHSIRVMRHIQDEVNENELLNQLRPDNRDVTWKVDELMTKTKCNIFCRAYKKTIAGLRTDYVLVDESAKCIDSNNFEIFHRIIEPTGDLRRGKMVSISTSESPVDLVADLKSKPEYITKEYKIINDGVPLWPEKFPLDEIKKIRKRIGEHAFQSEYLLNPSSEAENALYPPGLISSCFDEKMSFTSRKLSDNEDKGYRVLAADFAVATGPKADWDSYTVVEKIDNTIYLKHGERHRGYPKQAKVDRLKELYELFDCHMIILDPTGIGAAVKEDLIKDYLLPVKGQEFHSAARSVLLMALRIVMDDKDGLKIPRDPNCPMTLNYTNILFNELIGFKEDKNEKTGARSYASTSPHDDSICEGVGVLTSKGVKNIEDVKKGDFVLTKNKKYELVTDLFSKTEEKKIFTVKPFGSLSFRITDNHKVFVCEKAKRKIFDVDLNDMFEVKSQDLDKSKHLLLEPINNSVKDFKVIDMVDYFPDTNGWVFDDEFYWNIRWSEKRYKRFVKIDESFCRFIGNFVADGSYSGGVAFNKNRKDLISMSKGYLEGLGVNVRNNKVNGNGFSFDFCCIPFQNFLKNNVKKGTNKQLPDFCMFLNPVLQREIFEFYRQSDGAIVRNNLITATISKKLAYQMRNILLRLGITCNLRELKRHRYNVENKNQFWLELSTEQTCKYLGEKYVKKAYCSNNSLIKDGFLIKVISSISYEKCVDNFYDLQVLNNPTFCVEGTLVHNCAISLAMAVKACKSQRPFLDCVAI